MSDNQNWSAYGEQIKSELNKALQTGDFSNLSELVSQTVTGALNEAGKHISQSVAGQQGSKEDIPVWQKKEQQQREQWQREKRQREQREQWQREQRQKEQLQKEQRQRERQERERQQKEQQQRELQLQQQKKQQSVVTNQRKFNDVGSVSGVLYQVFGGIGLGISGLVAFVRLFGAFAGITTVAGWVVNAAFAIAFFAMIQVGVSQRKRLKRAKRYIQLCGAGMYGQIENLARDTGKSKRYVIKDIQKMLSLNMFPEGHLDEQKTCFMLNDTVYNQYLEAERNRRIRENEEKQIKQQAESAIKPDAQSVSAGNEQEAELNTMVAEGMECIRKLRDLNDKIPGEVISAKLFHLENLLKEIFNGVKEHPEQMHRMHKLMDYYLPTTIKLVEAYEEFERVSSPGEEIIKAKAEIEQTLDTINQAFTELLNNLFRDTVFDVTTDAQVLQTMLAREGLTKEMEFVKQNIHE
ncbi:MAG: 5-bromo-4-chloroindolyl phosphate hydrolysis family protein [Lachnospiraceae bacterium]